MQDIIEERLERMSHDEWAAMLMKRSATRNLARAIAPFARRFTEGLRNLEVAEADLPHDVKRLYDVMSAGHEYSQLVASLRYFNGIASGLHSGLLNLDTDIKASKVFSGPMFRASPSDLKPDADRLLQWITDNKGLLIQTPAEQEQYAKLQQAMVVASEEHVDLFAPVPTDNGISARSYAARY